ncbi:MAG: hypothetical protein CTY15_09160 [Methylocystis sp.]|nr:MAG: hypothetical protein CTY15_09160 [Methylocystis sp.]
MIVVDASVAVKWVVREAGHETALSIVDKTWTRIAPDLLLPEVSNVLLKKQRTTEITDAQVGAGLLGIKASIKQFVPSSELTDDAVILSRELNHSAYDCFYLACALGRGILLSADNRFIQKCRSGGYGEFVASLDDLDRGGLDARMAAKLVSAEALKQIARLNERIQTTFQTLRDSTLDPSSGRFRMVNSEVYAPAFDSPAYRRLGDELERMSADELGVVIALGWLGRSYHSVDDWPRLHEQACRMAEEGFTAHRSYFIAQMAQVAPGLEKLKRYLRSTDDGGI